MTYFPTLLHAESKTEALLTTEARLHRPEMTFLSLNQRRQNTDRTDILHRHLQRLSIDADLVSMSPIIKLHAALPLY